MYNMFCTVYSLYEFVDEKVENKLKSKIKSNQMFSKLVKGYLFGLVP